jgi:uncharacterized protein YbjT (DUF2867 family)
MALGFIEAVQAAGVRKVVYNGVYHPSLPLENHATTRPVEAALYASGLDFTILQPAMYMQGLDDAYAQARGNGALVMPWSKRGGVRSGARPGLRTGRACRVVNRLAAANRATPCPG